MSTGTAGTVFHPVASMDRIGSLDVLRGVALLGILLMNITGFALPHAYENPTTYGGSEGPNLLVWAMNAMFFEGTMRGIFSMLFGAGVVLLTSRLEARGVGLETADIYYRRTLWLVLFGVVHGYLLLWPGEILYYYGVIGLFLFPFRRMSARGLILVGMVLLLFPIPRNVFLYTEAVALKEEAVAAQEIVDAGEELDQEQKEKLEEWEEKLEEANPPPEKLQEIIDGHKGNYWSALKQIAPVTYKFESTGPYEWAYWDIGGLMILGMGLLKLRVFTAERSYRFYLMLIVVGYGIGLPVNVYETRALIDSGFDMLVFQQGSITYDLGRLPTTLGHVGVVMIVCKAGFLRWLTGALGAVGRTALSNYILHTLICVFLFTGVGLGLFGELQRYQLYYVVGGIFVVNLIVSPLWLRSFRFGPLEWLWRLLTYWKWQPMRRGDPATA